MRTAPAGDRSLPPSGDRRCATWRFSKRVVSPRDPARYHTAWIEVNAPYHTEQGSVARYFTSRPLSFYCPFYNTGCAEILQIFDAGEKLFIALVEPTEDEDDCHHDGRHNHVKREKGDGVWWPRNVVVRDDYEHNEDDIFLIDREFLLPFHPAALPLLGCIVFWQFQSHRIFLQCSTVRAALKAARPT